MKKSGIWNLIHQVKKIAPLLLFLIPYIIVFIIYFLIGDENNAVTETWSKINVHHAFYKTIDSRIALLLGFVMDLFGVYIVFIKEQGQLVDNLKNKIDNILNKSKIVFESGINEFNDEYLLAFHRILNALNEKESTFKDGSSISIYAVDNSDPRTWWSDTMTGYLALLANWKSMDNSPNRRSVHRIFVCQKNELLSPVFAKTISLHSLMGFKTYIITYPMYKRILTNLKVAKNLEKEVLIWAKTNSNSGNIPLEINFSLDESDKSKNWSLVKCYQSFWKINQDYNYRNALIERKIVENIPNFYNQNINSADIKIWFEFIAREKNDAKIKKDKWIELPLSYLKIIEELISKMECCKDANEVKHIKNNPFGIEIKTVSCLDCPKKTNCDNMINNGRNFDYTPASNVKKILVEYYKLN